MCKAHYKKLICGVDDEFLRKCYSALLLLRQPHHQESASSSRRCRTSKLVVFVNTIRLNKSYHPISIRVYFIGYLLHRIDLFF